MPDAILPPANSKSPAFQFYPKDFLSDANVISMDCAARGAYITLLAVCWVEVSLPDDDRVLARLAGAYPAEWKRVRAAVLRCFTLRDGRYYHKRLDLERQKQHDFAKEKREAGRKGASRRWHTHGSANSKPIADTIANDGSSFALAFASSVQTPTVSERETPPSDEPGAPQLVAVWENATTPPLPRCRALPKSRSLKAKARLREHPLDWWREVFVRVQASDFCRGQNDRGWVATFDWLIENDTNGLKVLEGKYDNRRPVASMSGEPRVSDEAILADLEARRALRQRRPA